MIHEWKEEKERLRNFLSVSKQARLTSVLRFFHSNNSGMNQILIFRAIHKRQSAFYVRNLQSSSSHLLIALFLSFLLQTITTLTHSAQLPPVKSEY